MSNEQRNTVWRFAIIFIIILIGFIAVIGRIIYIQTVERDKWMSCAEHQDPVYKAIPALRGNILDCNGNPLATTMPQYFMYMDTRTQALRQDNGKLFYQYVDSLSYDLARILQRKSQAEYKKLIMDGYRAKNGRVELCKNVNYLQRQQLAQTSLIKRGKYTSGVFYEDRNVRIQPYGMLASRTIGDIFAKEGTGKSGLEMEFEKELRGIDGVMKKEMIGGRAEAITVQEAQDGMDIVTTIDANLQDIVEKALMEKVDEKNAQWGCCILMETKTGYVRAVANVDRNSDNTFSENLNHAVRRVEPGSTFKTISLLALMNDGLLSIDDQVEVTIDTFRYTPEKGKYKPAKIADAHPRDTIYSVRGALAASSNIAFAKFVTEKYEGSATLFIQALQRLGVPNEVYSEITGYENPLIRHPKDTITVSKMSYGYSVEVSPMTLIMYYNAIANNGKMMRPMLVTAIQQNGKDVHIFKPEVIKSSIANKKVLEDIKSALHDVVWDNAIGTASVNKWKQPKAQSKIVSIAGKTGTAQLIINKKPSPYRHRMTFVGYFPEDNPQYTCLCMIEDPKPARTYDAGMDCGSTVRKIAEKTMAYTGCFVFQDGKCVLEKRN